METTYLIEFFVIDSTNMLYREDFTNYVSYPNFKIYNSYHFKFLHKLQPNKKIYK
jgi:hypothetical protein